MVNRQLWAQGEEGPSTAAESSYPPHSVALATAPVQLVLGQPDLFFHFSTGILAFALSYILALFFFFLET